MTYLLTYEPKQHKNKIQKQIENNINIMKNKTKYIAPHQRKRLSRYKLKKQTAYIEQILGDSFLKNV